MYIQRSKKYVHKFNDAVAKFVYKNQFSPGLPGEGIFKEKLQNVDF